MELPDADHDLSDLLKLENSEAHSARNATDDEQEDLPYDGILERYLIPTTDQHDFSISDLNQCSIFTADSFCIEISSAGNDINNSAKLEISGVNATSDTTDDEQEDLPYDGILECYLVTNTDHDEDNNSGGDISCHQAFTDLIETEVKSSVKDCEIHTFRAPLHTPESDVYSVSERSTSYRNNEETKQIVTDEGQTKFCTTKIPEVLQRHFSDDALLHPSQFIDYETIPEISIAESSEELLSIQTWKKCSQHDSETEQEDDFETFMVETNINVNQCSNVTTERGSDENDALSDENGRETISKLEEQSRKQDDLFIDGTDKENQCHRDNVERRSSSHDIKYGQGQVHYKLPDFSKIPPKVKIPKGNGHIKAFPAMKRTRSSPNLTGPSNVIKDILESMQPFVEHDHLNESGQTSGQVHAQVYQIPGDANENTANNVSLSNGEGFTTKSSQAQIFQTEIPCQGATFHGANLFCPKVTDVSLNAVHTQGTTEGERMSEMLEEQAQQIKVKIFQNLKSCLETLERNYLSTKEKHRNLQLQVYRTDSQIVGEFDTERQVAGQIFKLGMLLEDLQDQINEKERSQALCTLSPVNTRDTFSTPRTEKTEDVFALLAAHSRDSQLVDASGKVETLNLQPYSNNATSDWTNLGEGLSGNEESILVVDCSSPNKTSVPEKQICEQDPVHLQESIDYTHLLPSDLSLKPRGIKHTETSTKTVNPEFKQEAISQSSDQLSGNNNPLELKFTHIEDKNSLNVNEEIFLDPYLFKEHFTEWHLAENPKEISHRTAGKSWQENGRSSFSLNSRYEKYEAHKPEKILSNHGRLSFLIQEKTVDLDFPDRKGMKDSCSSDWLMSSFSSVSEQSSPRLRKENNLSKGQNYKSNRYKYLQLEDYNDPVSPCAFGRHSFTTSLTKPSLETDSTRSFSSGFRSRMKNTDTNTKGLYLQKSAWASSIPVYPQNKENIADKLHLTKYKRSIHNQHVNRYNFHVPFLRHSRFAGPVIPCSHKVTQQSKCWSCIKQKHMDPTDSKMLNSVLDQALCTAKRMQKTTERMLKKLSTEQSIPSCNRLSYSR
ncbi:Hypothetical predicted protein [Pelobates cultripes]|uniref:Protein AKNAD1 n=1 Tax=Pelobates cultripes TaxID=61616 RepID=A0AAD1SU75_PELCU|nr:Hypothetical predicted protein [Pelobates cultripes]